MFVSMVTVGSEHDHFFVLRNVFLQYWIHSRCTAVETYSISVPNPVNRALCIRSSIKSTSVTALKQYSPNRFDANGFVGGGALSVDIKIILLAGENRISNFSFNCFSECVHNESRPDVQRDVR